MKQMKKGILGILLALTLLFSGGAGPKTAEAQSSGTGDMAVHFLDVGQGLSILVQSGGQNLLYDGGDRSASSFVVSYLQNQQVAKIDYLISSHYDEDHVSGLIGCLNAFDVGCVIGADYVHDSSLYDSFMDAADAQGLAVQHPPVGTEYSFGTGSFTILSPQEIRSESNANSVAIKLANGGNSFVFTGDAEYSSEADMAASGLDLSCDVLSVGHHGSASSTSWDFLEATVPEYAVISCGAGNQYGHPDADTMEKLEAMEIQVFRTDEQGTVIALSDGADITWNVPPCNDYTPGDEKDPGTQPASQAEGETGIWEEAAGGDNGTTGDFGELSGDFGQNQSGFGSDIQTEDTQQNSSEGVIQPQEEMVWLSATGSKYHSIPDCGNMNPDKARQVSLADAQAQGYEACKKCW